MAGESSDNPVHLKAKALVQKKRASDAVELLRKHLDQDSTDRDGWELLGISSFAAKDYATARDAFHQLTRMDPKYSGGFVNLGAVQNILKEFKAATDSLRKAIQKDKKCAAAYYNLGIAQKGLNMNSMAVSAYREAIRLNPQMPEPYANLANLYIEMKNLRQAVKFAEDGVSNCPNFPKIQRILEKARDLKEGNRKAEAPLGRLVDEEELARKQIRTGPRDLSDEQRIGERDFLKNNSKVIREACKPIVSLLDKALPHQLHVLAMAAAQKDTLGEGPAAVDQLLKITNEIEKLRGQSRQVIGEIRSHLARTDPGL